MPGVMGLEGLEYSGQGSLIPPDRDPRLPRDQGNYEQQPG